MSLNKILSTARQAISVQQAAVQTAGQNVANSTTPGYTRQGIISSNLDMAHGIADGGVYIAGLTRPRDTMIDAAFRRETSVQSDVTFKRDALQQAEAVMGELSEVGLTKVLEQFWSSWSDLSTTPTGGAQREVVKQRAELLNSQFRNLGNRIQDMRNSVIDQLDTDIRLINEYAGQLRELNLQISTAEGTGKDVPDMRDQRDLLLDKLSEITSITMRENKDGSVTVLIGDELLVDRTIKQEVTLGTNVAGDFVLEFSKTGGQTAPKYGRVGASLDMINNRIDEIETRINSVVSNFVAEVNSLHQTGANGAGVTGVDFFNPAGTTMYTIDLSAAVRASSGEIRAGTSGAAGDGNLALSISRLRYQPNAALAGRSITDAYTDITVSIALQVEGFSNMSKTQNALVNQISVHRSSVSDVSVEEEMINLQKFQQAYTAATKVVSVVDEMMQDVLRLR